MNLDFVQSDDVSQSISDGVLYVRLDRAQKRNALSLGVLQQIHDIFSGHAHDAGLRLAVLTGAGDKAFASGGGLVELSPLRSAEAARAISLHGKAALNAIRRFPVPVVARVNGVALGGGAELALACDMRFASASATIGLIHARLAISPSWGGGVDLMRLVGYAAGTRLLARAEILSAPQALALGLFDGAAPDEASFQDSFAAFVAPMIRQPPHVMRAIKALALGQRSAGIEALQSVETSQFGLTWPHADHWAAVEAISDGRRGK